MGKRPSNADIVRMIGNQWIYGLRRPDGSVILEIPERYLPRYQKRMGPGEIYDSCKLMRLSRV